MMSFNDDDQIVLPPDSGRKPIVDGRVQLAITYNNKAPFEKCTQKVMLVLKGEEKSPSGLDLVVVLDISSSMIEEKLKRLKMAMVLLLEKLRFTDRFSIATCSRVENRLCPLRQMTEKAKTEIQNVIVNLKNNGDTNITTGLKTALTVLKDRSVSTGRVGAIMLISDGKQNTGGNAAEVEVGNVPVHTFGFGDGHHPMLMAIANNSLGGTYSDVHMDNLSLAIFQCLGGLVSVVAQNLKLTVTKINEEAPIEKVLAGNYTKPKDGACHLVTIEFGDLYIEEVRQVLVDLLLPDINLECCTDVLKVSYTYSFDGQTFEANPVTVTVHRMTGLTAKEQLAPPDVRALEIRLKIAEVIKDATADAEEKNLKSAEDKIANALRTLGDWNIDQLNAALRVELEELRELMRPESIFEKQGRPFAYSLLISLATQRQMARGSNISKFHLFATPAMEDFLEEAEKFQMI